MNAMWRMIAVMLAIFFLPSCDSLPQVTGKDSGKSNKGHTQDLKQKSPIKSAAPQKEDDDDDEQEDNDDDDDGSPGLSCDQVWSKGITDDQTGMIWRKLRDELPQLQLQERKEALYSRRPYIYNECGVKLGNEWRNATSQQLYLAYQSGFFKPNDQNNKCAAPVTVYPASYQSNWLRCPPNADCRLPASPYAVSDWLFCVKDGTVKSCDRCATGEAFIGGKCVDKAKFISCTASYVPVCTCNEVTHTNSCHARLSGYKSWTEGACINDSTDFRYQE